MINTTTIISSYGNLPVLRWKDDILSAVETNQVTIITAETRADKSTQVPQ